MILGSCVVAQLHLWHLSVRYVLNRSGAYPYYPIPVTQSAQENRMINYIKNNRQVKQGHAVTLPSSMTGYHYGSLARPLLLNEVDCMPMQTDKDVMFLDEKEHQTIVGP